ncbi:MAG: SMC-Scp complex subunit ScpB [Pseudomonadales bacterium]|nr:SMC-Scp complex subunit ScpB [Pseudomonadales bacterium]
MQQEEQVQQEKHLQKIIEGLLLTAGKPLSAERIAEIFAEHERPEPALIDAVLRNIEAACTERGFELKKVASGYRFQVKEELSTWISRLWEEKPQKYSRAMLETLAIIAYRQPITRGDIEKIRGVAVSSSLIHTLLDREWVRVVGHRDVPGRPAMFATTRQFLDYFNLNSLQQLPALNEIRDMEEINRELSLTEEQPKPRVLEIPPEEDADMDENAFIDDPDAVARATRPLEEIIAYGNKDLLEPDPE